MIGYWGAFWSLALQIQLVNWSCARWQSCLFKFCCLSSPRYSSLSAFSLTAACQIPPLPAAPLPSRGCWPAHLSPVATPLAVRGSFLITPRVFLIGSERWRGSVHCSGSLPECAFQAAAVRFNSFVCHDQTELSIIKQISWLRGWKIIRCDLQMLLHKKCFCEFSEWQYLGTFGILSLWVYPFPEHILNSYTLVGTQTWTAVLHTSRKLIIFQ